jgi:hypothetical protein
MEGKTESWNRKDWRIVGGETKKEHENKERKEGGKKRKWKGYEETLRSREKQMRLNQAVTLHWHHPVESLHFVSCLIRGDIGGG